jgi:hypothetical protein
MPDLIGRSRAEVFHIMHVYGLYFVTKGSGANTAKWVRVVQQSPRPDVLIPWHGQAVLTVTTIRPRGPREVPDLVGLSRAEVFAKMRAASLYFNTSGPGSSNGTWIIVLSQDPRPGTVVPWHAQVDVRVSTARPAKPPAHPKPPPTSVINGSDYKIGVATWYSYIPGRCATWYLPKGTRITVLDLNTGRSITCIISDRENHTGNHVVDLSETQFAELAPLGTGVISVKVSW